MNKHSVLVTGASGFVGEWVVRSLLKKGVRVRAGIHRRVDFSKLSGNEKVTPMIIDILDRSSLAQALDGVREVYHFAALMDPGASKEDLFRINVEGTRNVWECAAVHGVKVGLYCSTAAVYGLLGAANQPVSEEAIPRAVEPLGHSKLLGESEALEIGKARGIKTIVVRPVGVFGPKGRTPVGPVLNRAAFSSFLLARAVKERKFSFAHVEDVAEAAVHLVNTDGYEGETFNIAVDRPVSFEEAFRAYLEALDRLGRSRIRARILGGISSLLEKFPVVSRSLPLIAEKFGFRVWRPEFYVTYSSQKLVETSFRFKWDRFEDVLLSCMNAHMHR